METTLRIDTHAHLYDSYSVREWCSAAVRNLGVAQDGLAAVIVVDRSGQDSFARLRSEVPLCGEWREAHDGSIAELQIEGSRCTVIRGVQYVAAERIEVLGLGVQRAATDGLSASSYVSQISAAGGVPCLPWSPGKWLGQRGRVVRTLLDAFSPDELTVGDISLRSSWGPPSQLLSYARRRGFTVLRGTDPLPRPADEGLVGSYGAELSVQMANAGEALAWSAVRDAIMQPSQRAMWGSPNSPIVAMTRFLSSMR